MGLADDVRADFHRVEGETRKAAIYCSLSRAWMSAPNGAAKWTHSNCGEALPFIQDGLHMAFVATLAATYQDGKGRVTVPNLMKRLSDEPGVIYALAKARDASQDEVSSHLETAALAFAAIKHLKSYQSLKELRDEVVAHHTPEPEKPRATHGPLNRLMVRTIRLVDHMGLAINGRRTATITWVRKLRQQGVAFWSYGMDAFVTDFEDRDPFAPMR
jgi:hypothetical protein